MFDIFLNIIFLKNLTKILVKLTPFLKALPNIPRLYTLHNPPYTRKIAPKCVFSCTSRKKSVSLQAKQKAHQIMASTKIYIQDSPITILTIDKEDYISLTDMAHSQLQEHIIFKWMSLKNTIEYLGEWEALYNPNFNYTEFGTIRNMAGSNNFV